MRIAIVNQKGGSGKTTCAALITRTLLDRGEEVLAVDADPQGGLTALFGVPEGEGLFDQIMGGDAVREHGGLQFLSADFRLDRVAFTVNQDELNRALPDAAYTVIDTPPTMVGLSRAAIVAADIVFVPCEISRQALGPTSYTIQTIEELGKSPRIIFLGYKDREGGGYEAKLEREFMAAFESSLAGHLPRNTTAAAMATGARQWTPTTREKLAEPIMAMVGAAS